MNKENEKPKRIVSYKSRGAKLVYVLTAAWYVFEVVVNLIARDYTLLWGWLPSSFLWLNVCLFSGLAVGYMLIYKVGARKGL